MPTATSLSLCTGAAVDSSEVLTRLLSIFARRYRAFVRAGGDPERPDPLNPDADPEQFYRAHVRAPARLA